MNVSKRLQSMKFSSVRKLNPYADIAVKKGLDILHLNIGQPDIETPEIFYESVRACTPKVLAYAASNGIDELVNSFITYYKEWNINLDKSQILVTNGGSEALQFAMLAVCEPGDEILCPEPFYTNYNSFVHIAQVNIKSFRTYAEDGFHLPAKEEIVKKISDKTKAILISNPGNPTGLVYTESEIKLLAEIAKEHDLFLIADEVYREFVYDGLKYVSAMTLKGVEDRVILIDSISKRYSACGARIGLIASRNKDLMHEMTKLVQSRLSAPTIEQMAAASLINTPKDYFDKVNKEYEHRRNVLFEGLQEIPGVVCKKTTGAFYMMVKLPVENAEDFAKWLLTEFNYDNKTVMVAPGEGFYSTEGIGKDEVRISYCLNADNLKLSTKILKLGLEEYKKSHK
jgi:aspartate aminotransferase